MKKLLYLFPLMVSTLLLNSCKEDYVEPQTVASQVDRADAKQADNYTAHLRPEEETAIPPVISNATGQIILKLSKDGTELYYKLIVANIETVRFGHLHYAPRGQNGGIVVDLVGRTEPNPSGVIAEGVITSEDLKGVLAGKTLADLIAAIEAGLIYANVHSDKYPAGEIRGQVR